MINKEIKVAYFKRSGKYYTDATFEASDACVSEDEKWLNMDKVVDQFRATYPAPGLSSDGLEFYKVFTAEDGYPVLIKPME